MVLGFSIIGINIFYVIYTSYIYVCTCNVTSISMDKVYVLEVNRIQHSKVPIFVMV